MGAQLRVLRRRIKSVQSTKKITKAMELIATSRIAKAQQRVAAASPYSSEITRVLTMLASNATNESDIDHPLLVPRARVRRAGILVVTSDRGLAGAYNSNVLRTAEELISRLRSEDVEPVLYVVGRKGVGYFTFRQRPMAKSWIGFSEKPTYEHAQEIGAALMPAFLAGSEASVSDYGEALGHTDQQGVDELHLVYTRFATMMTQESTARRFAPMEVVEAEGEPGVLPSYEFEPDVAEMLADLLPRYVNTRIFAALLGSAASESAARRRAMKAATDNATELIRGLTREANAARQAEITQEISEIVGGADALAATGSEQ